ncbi:transcriptional regulator [Streptomyces sp. NPDC048018]|uniref:transcriptional regulator n=1 Tax=Streptomyces sp. NPDC048018 TaxID=3365499 RepID=UPI00371DDB46
MGHGVTGQTTAATQLDAESAATIAETLQALATPSRLMILTRLRLLRALGLVTGVRQGRRIEYSLYDNHVAQLLDEAVYHIEHLRLGTRDAPRASVDTGRS